MPKTFDPTCKGCRERYIDLGTRGPCRECLAKAKCKRCETSPPAAFRLGFCPPCYDSLCAMIGWGIWPPGLWDVMNETVPYAETDGVKS